MAEMHSGKAERELEGKVRKIVSQAQNPSATVPKQYGRRDGKLSASRAKERMR